MYVRRIGGVSPLPALRGGRRRGRVKLNKEYTDLVKSNHCNQSQAEQMMADDLDAEKKLNLQQKEQKDSKIMKKSKKD